MQTPLLYTLSGQLIFNGKIVKEIMELPKEERRMLMEGYRNYPAYLESIVESVGGPEATVRLNAPDEAFRQGSYGIIHPSTRVPGHWQFTWFLPSGEPSGHTTWPTRLKAIEDAVESRYILIHEIAVPERVTQ